jgi:peptidoglycan/LPS O-acetylase OafA/YrhL
MNKRIPELDALRGVAAISVVIFHTFIYEPGFGLVKYGVTGVDLFFMISGFVIFMSISQIANAREFIVNRFSRLFPVYWSCVTFTFLLFLIQSLKIFHNPFSFKLFIIYAANLTMLQNFFGINDIDGSYWTLLVELQFYALIVLLYQFKLLRNIEKIGIIILVSILIFNIFVSPNKPTHTNPYLPIFNHFPLFFAGIIFYKLYFKLIDQYKGYLIILCCLSLQIALFDHVGKASNFISRIEYIPTLMFYFILFVLLANHKLKFILSKYTLFFGKISYSLYVVHQFLIFNFLMPLLIKRLGLPIGLAGSISFVIVTILAAIITHFIETPMRIKFKQFFNKTKDPDFVPI